MRQAGGRLGTISMTAAGTLRTALLAVALGAGAADAATLRAVFTGTVIDGSGFDVSGLFGPPGGSLDGLTATLTFVYDPAVGLLDAGPPQAVQGGLAHGAPDPTLSATLTIGAHSLQFGGDDVSDYATCARPDCGEDAFQAYAQDSATGADGKASFGYLQATLFRDAAAALPGRLDRPFRLDDLSDALVAQGEFYFYSGTAAADAHVTYGSLALDSLAVERVDDPPEVPLPAPALLLGGALALLATRRRRT
jgi:hypothetical protein